MTPEVGGEWYVAHGEYGESSTSDELVPNERRGGAHGPAGHRRAPARSRSAPRPFAAAMLGHVEIVRAIVDAYPAMREAAAPHGIPLVEHARQGGPEAAAVVELLERAAV